MPHDVLARREGGTTPVTLDEQARRPEWFFGLSPTERLRLLAMPAKAYLFAFKGGAYCPVASHTVEPNGTHYICRSCGLRGDVWSAVARASGYDVDNPKVLGFLRDALRSSHHVRQLAA